jgi:hypothetical protein
MIVPIIRRSVLVYHSQPINNVITLQIKIRDYAAQDIRIYPFTKGTDGCTYSGVPSLVFAWLRFCSFLDRPCLPFLFFLFAFMDSKLEGLESDDDSRLRLELVRCLLFSSFISANLLKGPNGWDPTSDYRVYVG